MQNFKFTDGVVAKLKQLGCDERYFDAAAVFEQQPSNEVLNSTLPLTKMYDALGQITEMFISMREVVETLEDCEDKGMYLNSLLAIQIEIMTLRTCIEYVVAAGDDSISLKEHLTIMALVRLKTIEMLLGV